MTKRLTLKLFIIGLVVSAIALGLVLRARSVLGQNPPPCTSSWVTALQHIESDALCPTSLGNISPAISNLSFFTQHRCGFAISSAVQQQLAQLEQEAWPGNCNGVCQLTRQDIKNIITAQYSAWPQV
jgi:hypothetical protein